jgi:hypothetical protein
MFDLAVLDLFIQLLTASLAGSGRGARGATHPNPPVKTGGSPLILVLINVY